MEGIEGQDDVEPFRQAVVDVVLLEANTVVHAGLGSEPPGASQVAVGEVVTDCREGRKGLGLLSATVPASGGATSRGASTPIQRVALRAGARLTWAQRAADLGRGARQGSRAKMGTPIAPPIAPKAA